jgi:hypothetical protein
MQSQQGTGWPVIDGARTYSKNLELGIPKILSLQPSFLPPEFHGSKNELGELLLLLCNFHDARVADDFCQRPREMGTLFLAIAQLHRL